MKLFTHAISQPGTSRVDEVTYPVRATIVDGQYIPRSARRVLYKNADIEDWKGVGYALTIMALVVLAMWIVGHQA